MSAVRQQPAREPPAPWNAPEGGKPRTDRNPVSGPFFHVGGSYIGEKTGNRPVFKLPGILRRLPDAGWSARKLVRLLAACPLRSVTRRFARILPMTRITIMSKRLADEREAIEDAGIATGTAVGLLSSADLLAGVGS